MRIAVIAAAALVAACASPASRIKAHREAFDTYPAETQQKIRDGKADVGFTREQVTMALGAPARQYTHKNATAVEEIWVYGVSSGGPRLGLGFGMGSMGMGGGVSAGTSIETGDGGDARVRVVFQDGAAVSVEYRER